MLIANLCSDLLKIELTSAPILSLSPTTPIVDSINTYGTNKATSISGESAVMESAISLPSVKASSFVEGLSFQFPEMKGFLASSLVAENACWGAVRAGEKALAEPARRRAEEVMNFMVEQWFVALILAKNDSQEHHVA